MRVSVCVGDYAKVPYCIPGLEINVFSLEELCYCMKENAFLLDLSLLNDGLLDWMDRECGMHEFARALNPLVHKQGSLSAFVTAILKYVGFYDMDTVQEVERTLKQGAGLSGVEKRKRQIDSLLEKRKYKSALRGYDELLERWQEQGQDGVLPAAGFLAAVWHNKGVACAGLMLYDSAAECFLQACELDGGESRMEYLAVKRLQLSQKEYVDLVARYGEMYEDSLELEKRFEQATREWEQQSDYLRLYNRRMRRAGDAQKVCEEDESLVQALKEDYRKL